jgi:fatty acid desaturase
MPAELLTRYQVQLTQRESEPELKLRLEEARRDGMQRRWQARIVLRLLAVMFTALFLLATLLAVWGDVEQQRWGLGALMTILGSIMGFLVGRRA